MRRVRFTFVICSFVILTVGLVGCGGGGGSDSTQTETAEQTTQSQKTGLVNYTAKFDGEQPEREKNDASGNPECGVDTVLGQEIVKNDNGTLRDVVIAVDDGPSGYDVSADEVVIDQKNCRYKPHVTTVKAGQTVKITDSDPNMHNVRATQDGRELFNMTTFKGDEKEVSFEEPGYVKLECDIHPWMESWVYVTEHGNAEVTGSDGEATLEQLPEGDYSLEAWHEEFDSRQHSATVSANETVELEDVYSSTK